MSWTCEVSLNQFCIEGIEVDDVIILHLLRYNRRVNCSGHNVNVLWCENWFTMNMCTCVIPDRALSYACSHIHKGNRLVRISTHFSCSHLFAMYNKPICHVITNSRFARHSCSSNFKICTITYMSITLVASPVAYRLFWKTKS